MRNPSTALAREWFQGVNAMDAGAALGGLAASTLLPSMLVKETTTITQKILKLTASLASAAAAGFVFRNVSASAGKMAIAGGLAGTLTQALGMFTNIQIGRPTAARQITGRVGRSYQPEFESAGAKAF